MKISQQDFITECKSLNYQAVRFLSLRDNDFVYVTIDNYAYRFEVSVDTCANCLYVDVIDDNLTTYVTNQKNLIQSAITQQQVKQKIIQTVEQELSKS